MIDVELTSPLSPDECVARLRKMTGWLSFEVRPLIGRVSRRSIEVSTKRGAGNPYQPALVGRFHPHECGTVLRGTIRTKRLRASLRRLGYFVLLLATALFCAASVYSFMGLIVGRGDPYRLLYLLLMTALLLGFVKLEAWQQRFESRATQGEDRYLLDLVATAIGSPSDPARNRGGAWSGTRDWFERRQAAEDLRGSADGRPLARSDIPAE